MADLPRIQAWRLSRGLSVSALAKRAGLSAAALEALESGETDPPASLLNAVATAFGMPTSWLFADPKHFDLLFGNADDDDAGTPPDDSPNPVIDRILLAAREDSSLFVLLTTLIQAGDPKLLRAAEVSLRSLVKQSRQATVPWQSRPPGHFEPPSD